MSIRCAVILAPVLAISHVTHAGAVIERVKSIYTTVDLSACVSLTKQPEAGRAWHCGGLPGYPLYIAEKGHHWYLSAGHEPEKRRAATQTLSSANTPFKSSSMRMTVEWRFAAPGGHPAPYAMIVRYFTMASGWMGEILVVTRVTDKQSCQIARIDALAAADPIRLARHVADEQARSFDCRNEPMILGAKGQSPM